MTTANFYAQHVIPHRPPDTTIELKLTTWKKFGTYLKEMVDCGLVTVMPHGTNPMGYLTGIDRKHVNVRGYKKEKTSKSQTTKLQVVNFYIIPHHFGTKLRLDDDAVKAANAKSDHRRCTGMLTVPEARAILEQHVTDNELNVSSGEVRLDGALTDLLYKKQNAPPETLSRKDLNQKWIDKMEPAYALVEMPGNQIIKSGRGTVPRVSIEVSLRQGRKFITRLRGLEDFDIDPVAFTKDVSKRFACSGAIETDAVGREALKKGRVELVFQGHLIEELRALLLGDERLSSHGGARKSDYCLPKTVIDVVLKKGVPAKKPK
jgi:translation initiation factor 2D